MSAGISRRGFTLIELLVVITIIVVLAAILLPVSLGVREHARQTMCLNNLSQLSKAFRLYADDHEGRLPSRYWYRQPGEIRSDPRDVEDPAKIEFEKGAIWRYVKSTKVYLCPSDRGRPAGGKPYYPVTFPLSYSMNWLLKEQNMDKFKNPAKLLLLIHESRDTINDGYFVWGDWSDLPEKVHYNGTTVAYCDLHAKWQSEPALRTARDRGEWFPDEPLW